MKANSEGGRSNLHEPAMTFQCLST